MTLTTGSGANTTIKNSTHHDDWFRLLQQNKPSLRYVETFAWQLVDYKSV